MTLVHAKHAENRYVFYDESMNRYSPQRLMLLTDLRHALLNDELMIYYQPKLAIQANQIVGVEALLRWPHPQMGFVPPLNFIPIAEQCGLIKPLTEWILNRVCEQWTAWNEQGIALCISINLTAQDLQDESLTDRVSKTLTRFEILPRFIGGEISEKGLMSDREQGTKTLKAIHELGVRVTIDNFGTGYSSLAHLKNLPVDEIKIDQSFVDNLKDKPNEIAIVRSMVELGHNLGLDVIAEGVSTQRAFELLTEFHCDYVQGHHINPAVPAGELCLWLDESELWHPAKST
jgi:EAL domain-containing protein (putative c-di-GMP-specific phosphodiesterase class I)